MQRALTWRHILALGVVAAFVVAINTIGSGVAILSLICAVAAVLAIFSRRRNPLEAAGLGFAYTFAILLLIAIPIAVVLAFDREMQDKISCEGGCIGFEKYLGGAFYVGFYFFFIGVPASIVGGIVSFVASLFAPPARQTGQD